MVVGLLVAGVAVEVVGVSRGLVLSLVVGIAIVGAAELIGLFSACRAAFMMLCLFCAAGREGPKVRKSSMKTPLILGHMGPVSEFGL